MSVLIFGAQKTGNNLFSGHVTNGPCISEALPLYSPGLTCFIIDYQVNIDTISIVQVCSAINIFITLQFCRWVNHSLEDDGNMYQDAYFRR